MTQRQLLHRYQNVFDRIIACGDSVRRRLEEAGFMNVDVVWNCVGPRPERPPLQDPPTVAFAGRLVAEKGVAVLVDAFAQVVRGLPSARLLVIGEGPERQRIERRIAALDLAASVELTGWLTGDPLETRLRSAWVQVVPSLWDEPFGLAAAEAMMRGTAVVASARGGPTELIQDGASGILVPPGDPARLADALLALLRDPSTAERMGHTSRRFALDHLSEQSFADRMVEIYNEMCGKCCPTS
jgi:glycosyltransferase involved in cell wall biosynthesis